MNAAIFRFFFYFSV
ncbi:pheST operon leader peptide PheM [Edwardsiella ictaluri]|uniref:pheST attenuator peptide n=1 Tax=Edwardsiella ictaluri TaxID=67780 RepID=A0ABY8GLE9_EDWIC|nr:pheST operon leader peptide PheM [Edwardsiella ictaluri]EKS7763629.1 pheST operon leader peptide PheM [Edwardsiella ictaluri]EKS7769472.1 pheST operon leader peptide PheM [Edwardsiella ictaluri]EKS7773091.1 pheST operon leader peptide PheM [Edwardsiella ictaluri]EKS7775684.1 pheST operon leader peptide PheM [Edwardsiella ictaluri]EKS7786111.1 pheST operon leader peptide PheM [Edwardsiella ictaluri]